MLGKFDDLSPPEWVSVPIYDPPKIYRNLNITGFSVFEPQSSSLAPFLHPLDRNCAVSAPNALLGSIRESTLKAPALELAPRDDNITAFDLLGMSMKPLIAPPGKEEITIYVKGYRAVEQDDGLLMWYVSFPVGWHTPFTPSFPEHWRSLRRVAMWAEYGPDKLDWEFCIDDVRVRWNYAEPKLSEDEL
jgi:hypothetical protein